MIVGWDGLEERVQRRAAHLAHMSLRHDQMTPAKSLILDDVAKKKRRKQRGWRDLSTKFLPQSLYSYIEPLPKRIAPWLSLPINFYAAHCDRKDDDSIRQMAALKVINSARERAKSDDRVLWEIWSDGSVDSETGYGGAGGAIWSNDGVEPFWSKSVPAGMYASSYNAEVHALYCSVETFDGFISSLDVKPDHAVLLVCDSSSLFPALQSDPYSLSADVIPVWKLLDKISTFVSSCEFIWISSHCDIVRSDIVDILARSGTKMDQTACPLSVSAVKAYINRGRVRESVLKLPEDPSSLELDIPVCLRYIHCALNQIWSGKWSECYDYQVKIGKAGSPFCPTCLRLGVEVVDDVDHRLFRCPRFREVRLRCFGLSSLEPDRCDYVGRNTVKVARFVALARDV